MCVGSIHGRRDDVATHQRRPLVNRTRRCRDISSSKASGGRVVSCRRVPGRSYLDLSTKPQRTRSALRTTLVIKLYLGHSTTFRQILSQNIHLHLPPFIQIWLLGLSWGLNSLLTISTRFDVRQWRRHDVLFGGGDGFWLVKPTYPQIPISPRISATLF